MSAGTTGLLVESRLAGPDELCELVRRHARTLGAVDALIYLVDREQVSLSSVGGSERLLVNATLPGAAFTAGVRRWSSQDGPARLWMPLCEGAERLGLLAFDFLEQPDEETEITWLPPLIAFMAAVATLVQTKSLCGDLFERTRRSKPMTIAAELQSSLLPPRTFGAERVTVSGTMEPAYDIGGDTFDYALNGGRLHIALLDAMGHGLEAASLAGLGMAAYRLSRRQGAELDEIGSYVDEVVSQAYGGERFITGWLGCLEVADGRLQYFNAGHPGALLLRGGKVVKQLDAPPVLPFGFQDAPELAAEDLEPGDRVLVYTDGVVEARSATYGFFGEERLIEFFEREAASGHEAPEILRRLTLSVLDHQEGELQDDSSMLLLEWAGPPLGRT